MEPAVKQARYRPTIDESEGAQQEERRKQEWETKVGKMLFYVTVAVSLWFFYWFNGIQCPC